MHNILISKIRCLSPNAKNTAVRNYNHAYYIATREGTDMRPLETDTAEDLKKALSGDADNSIYAKYIHERPRSNGLFGNIPTDDINLICRDIKKISDEKCIYRGIVSLSEADARELGYCDKASWKALLDLSLPGIAEKFGINATDMKWIAAFHQEAGHPHVHYMLWDSTNRQVSDPFISIARQNQCREIFSKNVFKDEHSLYSRLRTASRNQLIKLEKESLSEATVTFIKLMKESPDNKSLNHINGYQLNDMAKKLLELTDSLPITGALKYKYMPPEVKQKIDDIVTFSLGKKELYDEYNRYMDFHTKLSYTYSPTKNELNVAIEKAREDIYNRLGNAVIKSVKNINEDKRLYLAMRDKITDEFQRSIEEKDNPKPKIPDSKSSFVYSSEEASISHKFSNYGDTKGKEPSKIRLGINYLYGKGVEKDEEKGLALLNEARENPHSRTYAEEIIESYQEYKLYHRADELKNRSHPDYDLNAAIKLYSDISSGDGRYSNFAKIKLGNIYLYYADVKDEEKGIALLHEAENDEISCPYAEKSLYSYEMQKLYYQGKAFDSKKEYKSAVQCYEEVSQSNTFYSDYAKFKLANKYLYGKAVEKDEERGLALLKQLKANKNLKPHVEKTLEAFTNHKIYELAGKLDNKKLGNYQPIAAAYYYEALSEGNSFYNNLSKIKLAKKYLWQSVLDKDEREGLNLLKAAKADMRTQELAQKVINEYEDYTFYQKGLELDNKETPEYSPVMAAYYYQKAFSGNSYYSLLAGIDLSLKYLWGDGLNVNENLSNRIMAKVYSSLIDQPEMQTFIKTYEDNKYYQKAKSLDDKGSADYNPGKAMELYEQLASKEGKYCCFAKIKLGSKYLWGDNVEKDEEKGLKLLEEAKIDKNAQEYAEKVINSYETYKHERLIYHSASLFNSLFRVLLYSNSERHPSAYDEINLNNKKAMREHALKNGAKREITGDYIAEY